MAFKPPNDSFKSPNKNNGSDKDENQGHTSQDPNEGKKKSKQIKKKGSKHNPQSPISTALAITASQGLRVPTSLPLLPVIPAIIPVTSLASYYSPYAGPSLTYPINDWNSAVSTVQLQNQLYNISFAPVPVVIPPVMTPICPYSGALMPQPILAPVPPPPVIIEELPSNYVYDNVPNLSPEQRVPVRDYQVVEEIDNVDAEATLYEAVQYRPDLQAPLESYLTLPRELFPTARMLGLDPNPIIEEFCTVPNIGVHEPWILDLEFGVPRVPVTRPLAMYDVKFNSIHCKNTPNAIHPGFESSSEGFKKVLLFYYDCIISAWYRGYVLMNCDGSVENFQLWMQRPTQVFGMCWP